MHKLSKLQAPLSHYILEARSLPMVKAFVASGINLNEENEQGLSVLYSACKVMLPFQNRTFMLLH